MFRGSVLQGAIQHYVQAVEACREVCYEAWD